MRATMQPYRSLLSASVGCSAAALTMNQIDSRLADAKPRAVLALRAHPGSTLLRLIVIT